MASSATLWHMAQDFLAGSCGGASGILAGYPFDTVKVLIQNQVEPVRYKSTFQTIFLVTKEDGFLRLYRGMSTPLVTVAFYNAITFTAYEAALKNINSLDGQIHQGVKCGVAGAMSGFVRTLFISPIEVVKVQLQIPRETKISALQTIKYIYREAGLKGFARGYLCCFGREPLAFATYFSSFEVLTSNKKDNNLVVLMSGGIAGILSWLPTYPMDVIKTRLQADGYGKNQVYKGTLHCLKLTISGDPGPRILYRGFGSCVYRAFVVNSAVLFVYTQVRAFLQQIK